MVILYVFFGANVLLAGYFFLIAASRKLPASMAFRYFMKCLCLGGATALAAELVASFVV
jgi:hypothetical protein